MNEHSNLKPPSFPGASATAAALLIATSACDPSPPSAHTVHTDSAGIPIATAITPLWGPGEGWTVDEEPLVEIGTVNGAPEYQFADVVAAVRLANGHIVVADRGASELRGYNAHGEFQWSAGRVGEGAGAEPPPFEVHAPDGTWMGSVALPPGLERGFIQYQAPYMEIGADYVLGVWKDELDVQYVRVYRVNK